jgi:hypothetical protein
VPWPGAFFVGGCDQSPEFCTREFTLGRIPENGELAVWLDELGPLVPLDDVRDLLGPIIAGRGVI